MCVRANKLIDTDSLDLHAQAHPKRSVYKRPDNEAPPLKIFMSLLTGQTLLSLQTQGHWFPDQYPNTHTHTHRSSKT